MTKEEERKKLAKKKAAKKAADKKKAAKKASDKKKAAKKAADKKKAAKTLGLLYNPLYSYMLGLKPLKQQKNIKSVWQQYDPNKLVDVRKPESYAYGNVRKPESYAYGNVRNSWPEYRESAFNRARSFN